MKDHINSVTATLKAAAGGNHMSDELRETHQFGLRQLENLKHERLAHLLVTLFFAEGVLLSLVVAVFLKTVIALVLFALFLSLLVPYVFHYYFLENTCQKWYQLLQKIHDRTGGRR